MQVALVMCWLWRFNAFESRDFRIRNPYQCLPRRRPSPAVRKQTSPTRSTFSATGLLATSTISKTRTFCTKRRCIDICSFRILSGPCGSTTCTALPPRAPYEL